MPMQCICHKKSKRGHSHSPYLEVCVPTGRFPWVELEGVIGRDSKGMSGGLQRPGSRLSTWSSPWVVSDAVLMLRQTEVTVVAAWEMGAKEPSGWILRFGWGGWHPRRGESSGFLGMWPERWSATAASPGPFSSVGVFCRRLELSFEAECRSVEGVCSGSTATASRWSSLFWLGPASSATPPPTPLPWEPPLLGLSLGRKGDDGSEVMVGKGATVVREEAVVMGRLGTLSNTIGVQELVSRNAKICRRTALLAVLIPSSFWHPMCEFLMGCLSQDDLGLPDTHKHDPGRTRWTVYSTAAESHKTFTGSKAN